MNEAIRVENVSVHYGEVHALDHVDLTLNSGSVCGLIGMNGSGKSTLFKVIMGNDQAGQRLCENRRSRRSRCAQERARRIRAAE